MPARILIFSAVLLCGVLFAEETPWGEAKEGIACRVIMKSDYCVGEALTPEVQIKNVGEKERTLFQEAIQSGSYTDPKLWRIELKGPNEKTPALQQWSGHGDAHEAKYFKPIGPNEVRTIALQDMRKFYGNSLQLTGEYTLRLTFYGAKPSKAIVSSTREKDGSTTHEYSTPTQDEIDKAWANEAVSNTVKFTIRQPAGDDLAVHEWGVFTVYTDNRCVNIGRKAEWADLPEIFYRQFPKERLYWSPAAWDKPIIYFHSQRDNLEVRVRVDFPQGAPVVWWPACTEPHDDTTNRVTPPRGEPFRFLEWFVSVGKAPAMRAGYHIRTPPAKLEPTDLKLPDDHWLQKARAVNDAALVCAMGSTLEHGKPWGVSYNEYERFIYYDGLVPAPEFLTCVKSEVGSITLKNSAAFAMKHLFVVDRRDAKTARFAYLADGLAAGAEQSIKLEAAAADWPASGMKSLTAAMVAAGLSDSEATSAVAIWRKGFFENAGVCAFYLLPQSEYERMLPIQITPKPTVLSRVGIAFHPWIDGEPELTKKVEGLIKTMAEGDFDTREAAMKEIAEIGGVSIRILRKAAATAQDPEVRTRCETILENIDASTWLTKPPKESLTEPADAPPTGRKREKK